VLKAKTAEKLAEPGADYSVGISYDGCLRHRLGFATRDRLLGTLAHAGRKARPRRIWFIIIVRRLVEEVDLSLCDLNVAESEHTEV
jgi:hypothetical protein